MTVTGLQPGYVVRNTASEDVARVQALLDEVESADVGEPRRHGLDVAAECRDSRMELTRNTWLAEAPGGEFAGFAFLFWGASAQGEAEPMVHPGHRGLGVGDALLDAVESRAAELAAAAPANARPRLHVWCKETKVRRRRWLLDHGYRAVRESYLMRVDLSDEPVEPAPLPAGIEVRRFVPGHDEPVVYAAAEEAFADHFLHEPATMADWSAHSVDLSTLDPSLWLVAWDADEVAGESLTLLRDPEAVVDSLSVRKRWRGRGLGLSLLTLAFAASHERGIRKIRLGVDAQNPTGALALYLKAGMRVERREEVYAKDLGR